MSSVLQYTPIDDIEKIRAGLKAGFASGKLKSIAYRKYQLVQLMYLIEDNKAAFEEAFKKDLNRPVVESRFLEIDAIVSEAKLQYKNVDKWASPTKGPFSVNWFATGPTIRKEPKGTVLIIAPFNYPLFLLLSPLCGAIAAGCSTLLKPSELTPATSQLVAELLHKYLDKDLVGIVNGAIPETTKVLDLQWDHILYTGGYRVAQIVATAAAKHLTPLTLELGGKSPVVVDPGCDIKVMAKRLLWGKAVNAGQTCVAPDYALVPRDFQDTFVEALKEAYNDFYPIKDLQSQPDAYARLVSPQAFDRLSGLLENTKGTIVVGGEMDRDTKFIAPTIVKDVKADDSLMRDEIFGPILPIVPVDDIDAAIKFINEHDHPLALYVFTQDSQIKRKVFDQTQSGAVIANETVIHVNAEGLPFGGVGKSGYGQHTGFYSFEMFTHLRAQIDSPGWLDMILKFRYPPYTKSKEDATKRVTVSLPSRPTGPPALGKESGWGKWFVLTLVVAVAGSLTKLRVQGQLTSD